MVAWSRSGKDGRGHREMSRDPSHTAPELRVPGWRGPHLPGGGRAAALVHAKRGDPGDPPPRRRPGAPGGRIRDRVARRRHALRRASIRSRGRFFCCEAKGPKRSGWAGCRGSFDELDLDSVWTWIVHTALARATGLPRRAGPRMAQRRGEHGEGAQGSTEWPRYETSRGAPRRLGTPYTTRRRWARRRARWRCLMGRPRPWSNQRKCRSSRP